VRRGQNDWDDFLVGIVQRGSQPDIFKGLTPEMVTGYKERSVLLLFYHN
jgi:hypothetical protein